MPPAGEDASRVVVIGAGPNGLVAANMLADAGWPVTVLEAYDSPGGAVRSSELVAPGFVTDWGASFFPLAAVSPAITALDLDRHGLRWCHAPVALAHPVGDGAAAVIRGDPHATASSLEPGGSDRSGGSGDGTAWRRLFGRWERSAPALLAALFGPFPPWRALARLLGASPRQLMGLARLALGSLDTVCEREFTGTRAPLLFAGNLLHTDCAASDRGGAFFAWLLTSLAQDVGLPVPEGGAGSLIDALVARLEARGGEVLCRAQVTHIDMRKGRAVAVRTADGTSIAARAVLADVAAPALYRDLIGEEHCPTRIRHGLRRFRWDHATVKVDWALDSPIPWTTESPARAGTVHLVDSLADVNTYAHALDRGVVPARPAIIVGQTTTADPTRSPLGTEAAWAYTHVPQHVRADAGGTLRGTWDDADANGMADRIEAVIERRAPGFRNRIRARSVLTPPAFEAVDANLVGGAVNGGTARLRQQLVLRPVPGSWGPLTPIKGLYLASAGAHPGGGVHGACGANAARAALADLRG